MTTLARGFTIFRDEAEAPVVETKTEFVTIAIPPPSGPLLVYAPDKENIDPLTGGLALSEQVQGKKRKTTLAPKAQPASPTKKARPLAEKPTKKSRTTDKKTKVKRSTTKRTTTTRTRREPSLPRLLEEGEETPALSQAEIDSKCKDLTVLPLADISEAYEQAVAQVAVVEAAEKDADATDKVRGFVLVRTDIVLSCVVQASPAAIAVGKVERPVTPPPALKDEVAPSSSPAPAKDGAYSTPERKRIFSTFTFSSPSPASERYASGRGTSVERFSDVVF